MEKRKVLFVCIHNSARSQMAEAFLNFYGNVHFHAESAGFEPMPINQNVVKVMKEIDFDLSENGNQDVFDLFKKGKRYDYVITVCDESNSERCPLFPGISRRLHWSFSDPASFKGVQSEILDKIRIVRDEIKEKILNFIENPNEDLKEKYSQQ